MGTLFLVGMMGAGKSTVGPLVADLLGLPFVDLDVQVCAAAGQSIPEIWAGEGEPGFRAREAGALAAVAGRAAVVACGGGVVLDPGNVALMRREGGVVWLEAPADVLAKRIGDGAGRPVLAGQGAASPGMVLAGRAPAYAAAAHRRVPTAGRSPREVAAEVVQWWSKFE